MRYVPPGIQARLDAGTARLASGWEWRLAGGEVLRYTDHDRDLVVAGETYRSAVNYTSTTAQSSVEASPDNLELHTAQIPAELLTQAQAEARRFDGAELYLFAVDWEHPEFGIIKLLRGTVGEIRVEDQQLVVEFKSLSSALQQTVGHTVGPACDATFTDARCMVDPAAWTVTGAVASAPARDHITDPARAEPDGHFDHGLLTLTSGANEGLSAQVAAYTVGAIQLADPFPFAMSPGDTYSLITGCDGRPETCTAYGNRINFRGFEHVPGTDAASDPTIIRAGASGYLSTLLSQVTP